MPPSIPTSFVPRPSPVRPRGGGRVDLTGAFNFFGIILLILAVVGSAGVFVYQRYLAGSLASEDAAVVKAQRSIDFATVTSLVRLHDRLTSASGLLNQHITYSNLFNTLESLTITHVRISSLTLVAADDHSAKFTMMGTAANFNALAAESSAIATEPGIKDAIFSNITINSSDKSVGFSLTATLDQSYITDTAGPHGGGTTPSTPAATAPPPTTPITPQSSLLPPSTKLGATSTTP